MLIDWFTVGAQAVNFLILVWLLQRFLYQPVLAAIDCAREEDRRTDCGCRGIGDEGASRTGEELRRRNEALEPRARGSDAQGHGRRRHAERQAPHRVGPAGVATAALEADPGPGRRSERNSVVNFRCAPRPRSSRWPARRCPILAGASLEDRMIEVFIARLRELPETQKLALAGADSDSGRGVVTDGVKTTSLPVPTPVALVAQRLRSPRRRRAPTSRPRYASASARPWRSALRPRLSLFAGSSSRWDGVKTRVERRGLPVRPSPRSRCLAVEPEPAAPTLEAAACPLTVCSPISI